MFKSTIDKDTPVVCIMHIELNENLQHLYYYQFDVQGHYGDVNMIFFNSSFDECLKAQ